jgi:hypothetical protein
MIGSKHQQHAGTGARLRRVPDQPKANRQILDPPQRPRRLGLAVDAGAQRGFQRPVELPNRR